MDDDIDGLLPPETVDEIDEATQERRVVCSCIGQLRTIIEKSTGSDNAEVVSQKIIERLLCIHGGSTLSSTERGSFAVHLETIIYHLAINGDLATGVLYGSVSPSELCNMSVRRLAPAKAQEQRAEIDARVRADFELERKAMESGTSIDNYECRRCKEHKAMYYPYQCRSGDEPTSFKVICEFCHYERIVTNISKISASD